MFEEAHFRILPNSNESNPKMFAKKKSIITTFACFVSTASISTSQMCPLKSFVPPGMPAVPGRLMDRGTGVHPETTNTTAKTNTETNTTNTETNIKTKTEVKKLSLVPYFRKAESARISNMTFIAQ